MGNLGNCDFNRLFNKGKEISGKNRNLSPEKPFKST
jgi:hypothetical protein